MFERRIYAREFRSLLGYGATWFRAQQRRGLVPQGRVDPGGRRQWFTPAEVEATLARLRGKETDATGEAGRGTGPAVPASEHPASAGVP